MSLTTELIVEFLDSRECVRIFLNEKEIGWLGKIKDQILKNFAIKNMERRDAQLVVYSRIVEEYEDRGFRVNLDLQAKGSFIILRWPSSLDPDEKKRMEKIIAKHVI